MDRPDKEEWKVGAHFLPLGGELADALARDSSYYSIASAGLEIAMNELLDAAVNADPNVKLDPLALRREFAPVLKRHVGTPGLALIASYVARVQATRSDLDQQLREVFAVSPKLGPLHTRLAAEPIQLYVTTNYDDLLEEALAKREPHVVVDRLERGLAIRMPGGTMQPVDKIAGDLAERLGDPKTGEPTKPIVFKMHGSIDRKNHKNDSYLITEEDYVNFLGRDQGSYIPPYINGLMQGKNLLFLGYSLEDWNVRVILSKLLKSSRRGQKSDPRTGGEPTDDWESEDRPTQVRYWAIAKGRSDAEQRVWQSNNLNIYAMDLREFTDKLAAALDQLG
jgi:hypothetical protein